jgi:cell division septum initiation protein DivIVA
MTSQKPENESVNARLHSMLEIISELKQENAELRRELTTSRSDLRRDLANSHAELKGLHSELKREVASSNTASTARQVEQLVSQHAASTARQVDQLVSQHTASTTRQVNQLVSQHADLRKDIARLEADIRACHKKTNELDEIVSGGYGSSGSDQDVYSISPRRK